MWDYKKRVVEHRRWLHRHPEPAFQEKETTAYLAEQLFRAGIEIQQMGESGILADILVNREYPTIAIRAEIDAVPIQEKTGLSFSSIHPEYMHACGHDANTAVLLTLGELLSREKESLPCNVRLIFEPAEETGEGARYMIQNGALENPKPEQILVFHFGNQEPRGMEIQQTVSTAGIRGLRVSVRGKASHFSQYKEGVDAMYAAVRFMEEVHRINRECTTERPFILGFGFLQAGSSGNIVAGEAELKGSLRTFSNADDHFVYRELLEAADRIERETQAEIRIVTTKEIPPLVNDCSMVKKGSVIGKKIFQNHFYLGTKPFLVGDNAAYYLQEVPGMRVVFLAGKEGETIFPIHNGKFDLDESVMADAVDFLREYLVEF